MLLYEGGVQIRADKAGVPCNTPQEVSVGGQPIYLQHVGTDEQLKRCSSCCTEVCCVGSTVTCKALVAMNRSYMWA